MYFWVSQTEGTHKVKKLLGLPSELRWTRCQQLDLQDPVFGVLCEPGPPVGTFFLCGAAAIISDRFRLAFEALGVDSIQLFPAVLRDTDNEWPSYYLLNILASYNTNKTDGPLVVRDFALPEHIGIDERVVNYIDRHRGIEPWGITLARRFDFQWFKQERYAELAARCNAIRRTLKTQYPGQALSQPVIRTLLEQCRQLIAMREDLPGAGGGTPRIDELIVLVARFKESYLNQPSHAHAYSLAEELAHIAFKIHHYMSTMCDEKGPDVR